MRPIGALSASVFLASVVSCSSSDTPSGARGTSDAAGGGEVGLPAEGGSQSGENDASMSDRSTGDAEAHADVEAMGSPVDGGEAGSLDAASPDADTADGAAPSVLDPNLPAPSHDCLNDTSANCIAIAGTYNGKAIDLFCNNPNGTAAVVVAGKWVIGCDNTNLGVARLYIPIQEPGPFMERATPDVCPAMAFEFSADTSTSVALTTSNLQDAELAGTVVPTGTAANPYRIVSGTFHGAWATPDSSCSGLYGSACAASDINVTFRSVTSYGTCLNSSECTAPKMCDPVGYYCN